MKPSDRSLPLLHWEPNMCTQSFPSFGLSWSIGPICSSVSLRGSYSCRHSALCLALSLMVYALAFSTSGWTGDTLASAGPQQWSSWHVSSLPRSSFAATDSNGMKMWDSSLKRLSQTWPLWSSWASVRCLWAFGAGGPLKFSLSWPLTSVKLKLPLRLKCEALAFLPSCSLLVTRPLQASYPATPSASISPSSPWHTTAFAWWWHLSSQFCRCQCFGSARMH